MNIKTFHLFLVILLFFSCVTTKRQKESDELKGLKKVYHNVTSKYNRNFNANVILDEVQVEMMATTEDNYSELLSLYPTQAAKPDPYYERLDQAIEKCGVAIILHRASDWTDDNYQLIGEAQYLKKDYESAEQTFRYIVKHFDPSKIEYKSAKSRRDEKKDDEKTNAEKKADEKDRKELIKERKKQAKDNSNNKSSKSRKQLIKERKKAAKESERLAKKGKSRTTTEDQEKTEEVASTVPSKKDNKKEEEEVFVDNPPLPTIEGDPKSYFLKHRPIYDESKLWLAKTLIHRDRIWEAEKNLKEIVESPRPADKTRKEAFVALANLAIVTEKPITAVPHIIQAIELSKDRMEKARYSFILGQLYEEAGQGGKASEAYAEVVKYHPEYRMEVSAELKSLTLKYKTGGLNYDRYVAMLERMAKDEKNINHKDVIYDALGRVHIQEKNFDEGIKNLSLAARSAAPKSYIRGDAYYTVAELYFDWKEYDDAKYYYDSTLMAITEEDERYERVSGLSKNLVEIAANIEIIALQDSLIKLSTYSDKELRKLAAKMKREAAEKLLAEKSAEQANRPTTATRAAILNRPGVANTTTNQSSFFAYDEKQLKKGIKDFTKEWGDIELTDNWRVAEKSRFAFSSNEEGGSNDVSLGPISDTELEEIFADVPKTEEELDEARNKIDMANFELGRLYQSELEEFEQSVETLEALLEKNPEFEKRLDAYYLLYRGYLELGRTDLADVYKNKIETEFGDTDYARAVRQESDEEVAPTVQEQYSTIFDMYSSGQFQSAVAAIDGSKDTYGTKHDLLAKFALLRAMCVGEIYGRDRYVESLKDVIAKYPNTEEEQKAKDIIRLLGIRFTETSQGIQEINPDSYFQIDENDDLHFILVAINKEDAKDMNTTRVALSNFNQKYYKLEAKQITVMVLQDKEKKLPVAVVRRFPTRDDAMDYHKNLSEHLSEFIDVMGLEYFAVTQRNYRRVLQLKSLDLYREFFVGEYLSK